MIRSTLFGQRNDSSVLMLSGNLTGHKRSNFFKTSYLNFFVTYLFISTEKCTRNKKFSFDGKQ